MHRRDAASTVDLKARLRAAWIDDDALDLDPEIFPEDYRSERRRDLLVRLERVEKRHAPPTASQMVDRLEFEADHDPAMPSWLRRPWFVPADSMLALDGYLVSVAGKGHSSSTGSGRSERMLALAHADRDYGLLVSPVPGAIPKGTDRRALEDEASLRSTEILGMRCRIHLWNDTEPAKAFQGLMEGRIVREGHKELGIAREYLDPSAYDFF